MGRRPRESGTPLAVWMKRHRVSGVEIGRRCDYSQQFINRVRAGECEPRDDLKLLLERVTQEMEREMGFENPVGVPAESWVSNLRAAG